MSSEAVAVAVAVAVATYIALRFDRSADHRESERLRHDNDSLD